MSLGRGLFLSSSFSKLLLLFSSLSLCSSLSIYPSALKLYICIFVFVSSVGLLIFDLYEFLALHITIGRKREKSASRPRVPNLLLTHLLPVLSVCLSVCLSRPVSSRLDSKGSSEEDYIECLLGVGVLLFCLTDLLGSALLSSLFFCLFPLSGRFSISVLGLNKTDGRTGLDLRQEKTRGEERRGGEVDSLCYYLPPWSCPV